MTPPIRPQSFPFSHLSRLAAPAWLLLGWLCAAGSAWADGAADLRATYQRLVPRLAQSPFHRPLTLVSTELPSVIKGDVYAVMDYPFATVDRTLDDSLQGPAHWCGVLMLHLNTKSCSVDAGNGGRTLDLRIGKKVEQDPEDAYRMAFSYRPAVSQPDYFQVNLQADSGPLGTRDYRIRLEAVALPGQRTFLHLTYAYGYGMASRVAMKTYLATVARNKVGFTPVSLQSSGQTGYIDGMRGLVERNAMRYYLAIDAYLGALGAPAARRDALRLSNWFNATEQYPRQLHEIGREEYMQMKLRQYQVAGRQIAARRSGLEVGDSGVTASDN